MYVPQSFFMKKEILQKKRNLSSTHLFHVKNNQNIAGCKGSLPKTCVRTTRKTSVHLQKYHRRTGEASVHLQNHYRSSCGHFVGLQNHYRRAGSHFVPLQNPCRSSGDTSVHLQSLYRTDFSIFNLILTL